MMNKILSVITCLLIVIGGNASSIDYVVEGYIEGIDGKLLYLHDYDKEIQ